MGRSRLLPCCSSGTGIVRLILPILFALALAVSTGSPAAAQAGDTHLVFSEVVADLEGTDRSREYIEIANLGTTPWDPRNHWIYRWAARSTDPKEERMLQIAGDGAASLQPIPPGGVLLIEWGRPHTANDFPARQGPNVFATGGWDEGAELADNDLESRLVLALFAPQDDPPSLPSEAYDFGGARMLAYFATVPLNEDPGTEANFGANIGMRRAAELGLWELGRVAPVSYDFSTTLRWPAPAPGQPIPTNIGRRASDYYLSRYGVPDLSQATRGRSDAGAVLPVYGTPGQPNLQFPGELIPGQTLADGNSLLLHHATATSATTTVGSPAAGIHLLATNVTGAVAANLFNGTDWSGWLYIGGPVLGKPVIADNPRTGNRILYAVDAITRELFVNHYPEAGTQPPAYNGWRSLGVQVQGSPVVAIQPGTGIETVAFNDASGQTTLVTVSTGAPQAVLLPGNAKLTDLALTYTPSGLVILGYEGDQLRQSVAGPDGNFSPLANVGPAASNRAPVAPLARFNPVASQMEVLAAGPNGALSLTHVKLGATRAEDTVSAPISTGISTDSTPGMAVNSDTGDVMIIARGADRPLPEGERLNPTGGQALTAVFRNSSGAFDPPSRIGTGLMPPGASPDVVYNPGTKQYERFVVGEDNQLYRNVVAP